jgi:hypothetical protein
VSNTVQSTGNFMTLLEALASLNLSHMYTCKFYKLLETARPVASVKPLNILIQPLGDCVKIWDPSAKRKGRGKGRKAKHGDDVDNGPDIQQLALDDAAPSGCESDGGSSSSSASDPQPDDHEDEEGDVESDFEKEFNDMLLDVFAARVQHGDSDNEGSALHGSEHGDENEEGSLQQK